MHALSRQNQILGVLGAVEAGIALWYFTTGRWLNGIFYVLAVTFLVSVYLRRLRKPKGPDAGRRY